VFGLWAVVLAVAMTVYAGWEATAHYPNDTVNSTEPLFVFVIMALALPRPVLGWAPLQPLLRRIGVSAGSRSARSCRR
jgi:hypothetical protein